MDQSKKTMRHFYCRDVLWETFEQMANDFDCSIDYLINEAMRFYARSKNYNAGAAPPPSSSSTNVPAQPANGPVAGANAGGGGYAATRPPTRPPMPPPAPSATGASPQLNARAPAPPAPPPRPPRATPAPPNPRVTPEPSSASTPVLFLVFNNQRIPIDKDQFIIGRGSKSSDLAIKDGNISRKHAAVIRRNGMFYIKDLGSTNGIDYKGMRIDNKRIDEGDIFHICDYELRFTYRKVIVTYEEALDGFRHELRTAFANPAGAVDYGNQLVLAAAGVAEFIGAARKDSLRGWARDIKRWKVLPKTERERLVAAGLRQCAMLATEKPIERAAPKGKSKATAATRGARNSPPSAGAPTAATREPKATAATREGSVTLGTSLLGLPGVGPATAQKLADKGLFTVGDAVYFLPRRWDDLRQLLPIRALVAGELAVTRGTVEKARVAFGRGRRILDVTFVDDDGSRLGARWFYFRGGMQQRFAVGARFVITGVPRLRKDALEMVHPETILEGGEGDEPGATGGVRVRYPEIEGVPGRTVEKLCRAVAERYAGDVPDGIPDALATELQLLSQAAALRELHLPSPDLAPELVRALNDGTAPPMRRLVFDEFFFLQLGLARRRGSARREPGLALTAASAPDRALRRFMKALPFAPTGAQTQAIGEIAHDLAQPHPMHRLLQGDVGSGKTVVAFAACELACASGLQAAIMAPTEILAEQHARTLTVWAEATGRSIALMTASTPRAARESQLALLAAGKLDLVVGTHALLAERVSFAKLGVVVIDEQHRFGVAQRALLRDKGGMLHAGGRAAPHLLVMTATPIPRTLALTAYGDLDLTILDELPPGREPPATKVLHGASGRARALKELRAALDGGRQAYWVCPLIEESEKLELQDVKIADVTEAADWLAGELDGVSIGLVHGRLATADRDRVMRAFRSGELRVLVATTVIEVGVDVPQASMMVIEGAERFGLAQLHQLRGRIGRGGGRSSCLLLAGSRSGDAGDRLAVMAETSDGFKVAEEDLRIRGPGELFGTRQAGLPRLRYADLIRDVELLRLARLQAFALLERDPQLELPEHARTKAVLDARWAEARLFGEEAG